MDEEITTSADANAQDESNSETAKNAISADLIRGHINTIILRTLYDKDKYGYEIMNDIEQKSHGQYSLKQPTLYSALKRLESQGYIKAYWKSDEVSSGGRRKYFTLTESGREITETNQKEWEYSRTIIDSLISDKSFDFREPAPTPVDFRILTQTTSRVPVKTAETGEQDLPTQQQVIQVQPSTQHVELTEEQRARHENYKKLFSTPTEPTEKELTDKEKAETDNFIYILKPETERDYKNLINNIYNRTIRPTTPAPTQQSAAQQTYGEKFDDAQKLATSDGLKINSATPTTSFSTKPTNTTFNLGKTLFVCSAIVFVFILFESVLCLLFRDAFQMDYGYPLILIAIGAFQAIIFSIIYATKRFGIVKKPTSHGYVSKSIVITILTILIIVVVALLLNINLMALGDVMSKLVIPCITALSIPLFTSSFYFITK